MNLKKYFSSYWLRSAFYTILQRLSLTLFGLFNFMILVRVFSHEEMGVWALFLTVTSIFEATKSGLLKNAHIRYVSSSDKEEDKVVIASSSLIINLIVSFLFILFILFFSQWLSKELNAGIALSSVLLYFIPGIISTIFFSHFEAIQQSFMDFKGVFAGYFVRQVIFFCFIAIQTLTSKKISLNLLALYQFISIATGTITLFFFTKKYLMLRFQPSQMWVRKILGYGGYIFGSGIMGNIYSNVDQIMTARFISSSSVSFYNTASRINGLVDVPSYAAAEILFPKSAKASVQEGTDKVKYLYERMVAILLSFTIPAAIFIILFPSFVITIVAGSSYIAAAPILQLYMLTGLTRPMQNQAANLLNSIDKPSLCFWINTLGLCETLIINYFCLYYFGFYGAAIGTLISSVIGSIFWYFVMKKQIGANLINIAGYIATLYKSAFNQMKILFYKQRNIA